MNTSVGSLHIDGDMDGASLRLKMTGAADLRDGGELRLSLLDVHREALAQHAHEVWVDLKAVEFMNSTALGAFVGWMTEIHKTPGADRYHLTLVASKERRWQRISLHALASFAPETISVLFDQA
ncbi:MAG: hypothetical protein IPJ65_19435 [Archangiaceae bacterium]|nr:hypothetical protein [Archangiaceae bacterium]